MSPVRQDMHVYLFKGSSGDECADIFAKKFGPVDFKYGIQSASTDFVRSAHTS